MLALQKLKLVFAGKEREDYGFEPFKCLLAAYTSSLENYSFKFLPLVGSLVSLYSIAFGVY